MDTSSSSLIAIYRASTSSLKKYFSSTERSNIPSISAASIKVSEFYGTDFVGPEQVEVTEEVLDYLISQKRIEKKKEVDDYRNTAAFGFDDVEYVPVAVLVKSAL